MKKAFIISLILAMIPLSVAFAHKVIIFAWVEDGMIYTESSFGSKRKAKDCAIKVFNEKGQEIHKGQTDLKGNYSFKIPENIDSDLILKLEAGTGHQGQWKISKDELAVKQGDQDIKAVMEKKETLEKSPSLWKIITGIAIIFILAIGARLLKRKIS
jgi:nickel transport protein